MGDEGCNVTPVPGYFTVYGYHFGTSGDGPRIRIYQHNSSTLIYDGSAAWPTGPVLDNAAADYGHLTWGANYMPWSFGSYNPALLTPSDVTVYYLPPTSIPIPNNIDHVAFSQNPAPPPTYISINPTSVSTSPYETFVTGVAATFPNTTNLLARIYAKTPTGSQFAPGGICSASVTVTSATNNNNNNPWWQVKDSDVQTNGDLTSKVPSSQFFDLPGAGTYPGIPAYGGSTQDTITSTNVSTKGWLANSPWSSPKVFDYAYFANQIPSDITPTSLDGGVDVANALTTQGSPQYGYYWYKYDGANNGGADLNLPAIDFTNRKVILLVANANLNITGNINLTKGQGFFLAITGKSADGTRGNITVNSNVTSIVGLYVADNSFKDTENSTVGTEQLHVRGSIAAYGGVTMLRDVGAALNGTTPSDLFEYAPDQILLFPRVLGVRKINWKEVAP